MANAIVKDGALVRYPATINSLRSLVGDNIILPKSPSLPITVEGYTLLAPVSSSEPVGDVTKEVVPVLTNGQWTQAWSSRAYNAGELASQAATTAAALKLSGVAFTDATDANAGTIMCSATKEDMWGLTSVQASVGMGNSENFRFDNGNVVVLTPTNAAAFLAVWAPFRSSFF